MHEAIQFLKELNIVNILAIFGATWYFTRDLKKEFQEIKSEMKFMNIRVSRLEGTTYGRNLYAGLLPTDAKQVKDD